MSQPSIDARAIAAAVDNLTTQLVRALGGQTTPVVGQAAHTDDRAVHERNAAALYRQGLISESELNAVFATFYPDGAPAAVEIDRLTAERDRARHERDVIAVDLETADRIRADVQRDRDQHAAVLAEVLAAFVNKVDGYRSIPRRSAEADVVTLDKWRSVLAPTVERPWWQTVAELRAEVEQAQAAIERVRALHPRVLRMQALICAHCGHIYPCPTVRTLDGTTQPTPTLPAAGARQDVAQP